jgi:hypothetical protein
VQNTPPEKVSQRVQLPADFLKSAESDAARVGLSLPTLLGLSARRAWRETVDAFNAVPHSDAERALLGLPTGPRRENRKRGAK